MKPEQNSVRRILLLPYYLFFAMYYWIFKQIAGNVRS
jgi:hypothetical protein